MVVTEQIQEKVNEKMDDISKLLISKYQKLRELNPRLDSGLCKQIADQAVSLELIAAILVKLDML